MIKSAGWTNLNNDEFPDLIVAGEWMPIKIFINENGVLKDYTKEFGLSNSNGMWNKINIIDIDFSFGTFFKHISTYSKISF